MEQDLISYLDRRFDETTRQIEAMRQENAERFERIDQRFEQVDQRFEQVDQRFEQVDQRFEQVDTRIRQTQVLVEDLRSDLQGVAEGVANVNEKLDRYVEHAARQRENDRSADRVLFAHQGNRLDSHEKRLSRLESTHT